MVDTRIVLSGLWVALMLTYLLGDVLRIFAGDFKAGEMMGSAGNSGNVFCRRITHVDSDCYGCSISDVEVSRDTLGHHHRSHNPFWF